MTELILAALAFVGSHLLISSTPLRPVLVAKLGTGPYLGVYSLVAIVSIWWLVTRYNAAQFVMLWTPLMSLKPVGALLMLIATFLVVVGLTTPSPTSVGGDSHVADPTASTGILAITRHPFLWGIAIWAAVHFVINGDAASCVFFGAMFGLAVVGGWSIDRKRRKALGNDWVAFSARTSNLPFLALVQRRTTLKASSIGWWRVGLAILVYALLLGAHRHVIGVSPL